MRLHAMCCQAYVCLLDVPGLCNARHIFIVECGIARLLCAMRVFDVRATGIILTPVPNFVSVAAPVAELARGEKSRTQSIN